MKFVYLVQGSRETLSRQAFGGAPFCTLCYEGEFAVPAADACLSSRTASWAGGRNLLMQAAVELHPDADYLVFCDDDVDFIHGGFGAFQDAVRRTRPTLGFPLMPKARLGSLLDEAVGVQRAVDIDEQMYAVHRSAWGLRGLAPLETRFDELSWYVASMAFEYLAATRFAAMAHQYNDIELRNDRHVWQTGETLYAGARGDRSVFAPAFAAHAHAEYGGHDPHVIAQFAPPASETDLLTRLAARRATLSDIRSFDGTAMPVYGETLSRRNGV